MMTKKEKKIERSRKEKIREGKDLKAERGMRRPVEVHCDVITVLIREEVDCFLTGLLDMDEEDDG